MALTQIGSDLRRICSALAHYPFLACSMRPDSSPWWSCCIHKSDDICLNQASRGLVCFQRLCPNTEQIAGFISTKRPLGSVFPLIEIGAGWGSRQDNNGIRVSRPDLKLWARRLTSSGCSVAFKEIIPLGQRRRCRWNTISDDKRALLHSWWYPLWYHLRQTCKAKSL